MGNDDTNSISIIFSCMGIIGTLIWVIATGGVEYPLIYSKASKIGFAVTCMDLRFAETNHMILRRTYTLNSYDSFVAPGPALALGQSTGVVAPSPPGDPVINTLDYAKLVNGGNLQYVDETFYNAFVKAFKISAIVNQSEELILMEHEECGYYTAVSTQAFDAQHTMKQSQISNLRLVRTQLATALQIPQTKIRCYWVSLYGNVDSV